MFDFIIINLSCLVKKNIIYTRKKDLRAGTEAVVLLNR